MNQSIILMIVVVVGVVIGILLFFLKQRRSKTGNSNNVTDVSKDETKTSEKNTIIEAIKKEPQSYVFYGIAGSIFLAIIVLVAVFSPTSLAPYVLCPLLAGFAYFFSNKEKYKNWKYATAVGVATAVVITLWIFPEVLRMVTDPLIGDWSLKEFAGADNYKLYVLAGGILFLLLLSGYAYEAIILGVILLILW